MSTGRKFLIVSLPSLTSVFPAGKGITSLTQDNLGGGYPSAWQVSCIVADSIFETSDEGFWLRSEDLRDKESIRCGLKML